MAIHSSAAIFVVIVVVVLHYILFYFSDINGNNGNIKSIIHFSRLKHKNSHLMPVEFYC